MIFSRKFGIFSTCMLFLVLPLFAHATPVLTSQNYVDSKVAINQGTGTNNANVGKTLVVNSSGNLELGTISGLPAGSANRVLQYNGTNSTWEAIDMDTTPTANSLKPVTSGGVKTAIDGRQPATGASANNQIGMANGTWYTMVDGANTVVQDDSTNSQVKINVAGISGFTNVNGSTPETQVDNAKLPTASAVKSYVDGVIPSVMTGASVQNGTPTAGTSGLVPAPAAGAQDKVLTGAGSWTYTKIPVASGDPNATSSPGSVSAMSSIWVQ